MKTSPRGEDMSLHLEGLVMALQDNFSIRVVVDAISRSGDIVESVIYLDQESEVVLSLIHI